MISHRRFIERVDRQFEKIEKHFGEIVPSERDIGAVARCSTSSQWNYFYGLEDE